MLVHDYLWQVVAGVTPQAKNIQMWMTRWARKLPPGKFEFEFESEEPSTPRKRAGPESGEGDDEDEL